MYVRINKLKYYNEKTLHLSDTDFGESFFSFQLRSSTIARRPWSAFKLN